MFDQSNQVDCSIEQRRLTPLRPNKDLECEEPNDKDSLTKRKSSTQLTLEHIHKTYLQPLNQSRTNLGSKYFYSSKTKFLPRRERKAPKVRTKGANDMSLDSKLYEQTLRGFQRLKNFREISQSSVSVNEYKLNNLRTLKFHSRKKSNSGSSQLKKPLDRFDQIEEIIASSPRREVKMRIVDPMEQHYSRNIPIKSNQTFQSLSFNDDPSFMKRRNFRKAFLSN